MKNARQKKVKQIIESMVIRTQSELAEELHRQGFHVTQATVSRDIKELGLIKVPVGKNSSKYSMPQSVTPGNITERVKRMFRDNVNNIDFSENLILIRTIPGAAMVVASAIDYLGWKEILGSVAGDDTILVIAKPKEAVPDLMQKFSRFMV
ncbi:MAG: arginine repressor [Bacillota bacterium]|jgi:transcriptional regulator of arginine metabolism|nr:arginine repressor [Clostridia bacterium]